MPVWTQQQAAALKAVAQWHRTGAKQVFRLYGYAGTGKTTLATHFAAGIGGTVAFAAFTGKAAHVMRNKGCSNATTIHGLIYRLEKADEKGKPIFILNPDSHARRTRLIVIDEASMVNATIGRDLLGFRVPIVVIGDPAQLPPVEGAGFFTTGEPDFMLTEIHRQARDKSAKAAGCRWATTATAVAWSICTTIKSRHAIRFSSAATSPGAISIAECASGTVVAAPTPSSATSSSACVTTTAGASSTAVCGSLRRSLRLPTTTSRSAWGRKKAALPLPRRRMRASSLGARSPTLGSMWSSTTATP